MVWWNNKHTSAMKTRPTGLFGSDGSVLGVVSSTWPRCSECPLEVVCIVNAGARHRTTQHPRCLVPSTRLDKRRRYIGLAPHRYIATCFALRTHHTRQTSNERTTENSFAYIVANGDIETSAIAFGFRIAHQQSHIGSNVELRSSVNEWRRPSQSELKNEFIFEEKKNKRITMMLPIIIIINNNILQLNCLRRNIARRWAVGEQARVAI